MTVSQAIREAAQNLSATSDTARLDAEVLMTHALGVSRSELLLRRMEDAVPESFAALVERRARCEPVAYIVGEQDFYGRTFAVDANVLIPRADSESVVEAALAAMPNPARVLDCGVGSGALLLTVLAERPRARGIGIDNSPGALDVAKRNAAALGLADRANMRAADWHGEGWADDLGTFDLVLANPPYVEQDAPLDASVREFEPHGALFAGPDGLDDYRALIPQLPVLLAPGGVAVFEIGATQADAVCEIAARNSFAASRRNDLAGRPRAIVMSRA